MRVLGYKGDVVLDPHLDGMQLSSPKSMQKFQTPGIDEGLAPGSSIHVSDVPIEVVNFGTDRPVYLNQQLLFGLEWTCPRSVSTVKKIQTAALEEAGQLAEQPSKQLLSKALERRREPSQELDKVCKDKLSAGFDPAIDTHLQFCCRTFAKKMAKQSTKVPVDPKDGVYAYLVPDWWGVLLDGTAYIPKAVVELDLGSCVEDCFCVIFKCPFYEIGNVRRLRLARPQECRELSHLTSGIVLSTRGSRPEADKMFGADYDGDEAFAIWDKRLVPLEISLDVQPYRATGQPTPNGDNLSIFECLAKFIDSNWDSLKGFIGAKLQRLAAEGPERVRHPAYAELALRFSDEMDSAKTGACVNRSEVEQLFNEAMGFAHHKNRSCKLKYPAFRVFDPNFRLRHDDYDRNDLAHFRCLTDEIFVHAMNNYRKLESLDMGRRVEILDDDLALAWEELSENAHFNPGILRSRARELWRKTNKEYAEHRQQRIESESEKGRQGQVRQDVLELFSDDRVQDGNGLEAFERSRRRQAESEALKLAIPFRYFALAMYIEKYESLREEQRVDIDPFPWTIACKELCQIKQDSRKMRNLIPTRRCSRTADSEATVHNCKHAHFSN